MVACTEAPQLYFLAIPDLFGVTVTPLKRDVGICVCIDKYIEGAVTIQHWQEGH
jgi:hypothetical protein